ncbi:sll1863 family stress response protein [Humidesulfovibrio idahonensis]
MARQEFLSEMEAKLTAFDAKMAQLAARPKPKGERAALERQKTYYFLKAQRDELREQLHQAEAASEDGWNRFKVSVERVYGDMVRSMDEACNRIDGPEEAGLY